MSNINLDCGFLLMYEWMDAMDELSDGDFGALVRALAARQRCGTPLPRYENCQSRLLVKMIEPFIIRRLEGQIGGKKARQKKAAASRSTAQEPTQVPTQVPTQEGEVQRREEKRREEKRIFIEERSGIERASAREDTPSQVPCDTVSEALPTSFVPPAASAAPSPTEKKDFLDLSLEKQDVNSYALTSEERERLISKGIPRDYVEKRESRANERALSLKLSAYRVLLSWWQNDRASVRPTTSVSSAFSPSFGNSFDTDDFFSAAIAKSARG